MSSAPYLNDLFTIPSNLAGVPALSLPVCLSAHTGLPIGLQIIGGYHAEGTMLDVAEWMEQRVREDGVEFDLLKKGTPAGERLLELMANELEFERK